MCVELIGCVCCDVCVVTRFYANYTQFVFACVCVCGGGVDDDTKKEEQINFKSFFVADGGKSN